MKKFLLLIPALLLAVLTNAAVINITPTSPHSSGDNLRRALSDANDGDEIIMAAGTYVETNGNYIAFTKNLTVRAAEGANVLIQPQVPITVSGGVRAEIIGVKIDASRLLERADWYEHVIQIEDASTGNQLALEGCELYGFALNKSAIYCKSDKKLDAVTINNCYFHNVTKNCLFIESTAGTNIQITNSTFANIATASGYYAGVIDTRATSGTFLVDHCTFYNVQAMNTDYAAIGKVATPGAVVSNCIFAMPTSTDELRAIRDVATANNCLVYNYTKDSNWGIHSSVTKNNCIKEQDPLFADAANGNFSISANYVTMLISPACGAATDKSDLGDPRWHTAPVLPSTNFAAPGYVFLGTKAQLSGSFALNGGNNIQSQNKNYAGVATWKIHAERNGKVQVTLNIAADNTSGHLYEVALYDANDVLVGTALAEPSDSWEKGDQELGIYEIPEAGDYTVKLTNSKDYSSTIIEGVTFTYLGGAVQNMPGTANVSDAWYSANGTRADGMISFADPTTGWAKWNVSVAKAGKYNVKLNINNVYGHNMTVALYRNESDESPISVSEGATKYTKGTPLSIDLGDMDVPVGNYIMKVTNATSGSDAKIISVVMAYNGGAVTAIPGALIAGDAVIVSPNKKLHHDENACLHYNDNGTPTNEYAYWKIHADAPYSGKVTLDIPEENSSGHQFHVELYSALDGAKLSEAYEATDNHSKRLIELEQTFTISDAGDYFIKVINHTKWSSSILRQVIIAPSISNIDEDEDDISAVIGANDGKAVNVQLNRTFVAGMYNTICLPFAVSAAEMARVFPGAVIKELTAASIDEGDYVLNLSFSAVSEMVAGKPYIIKPAANIANPKFMGVTIDKTLRPVDVGKVKFLGNFVAGTIPASEDNLFIGANNTLYFPLNDIEILGMRAYFQIKSGVRALVKGARIVEHESTATGIENIMEQPRLAGQKVFENGQIVIIRDGIRYNIMGVRMN